MQLLKKFFLWFNWLSLDVVLGSMAGMLFFSRLLHVSLDWKMDLLLGLTVWVIYTADHLLDSRKKAEIDLSPRHQFHARNFKTLGVIVFIAIGVGLFGAIQILGWSDELYWSVILSVLVAGSMGLIRLGGKAVNGLKELSTAILYVLGISWIPLLRTDSLDKDGHFWLLFGLFSALAFLNLLMLSWLDRNQDKLAGFPSAALLIQPEKLIQKIRQLAILLILGSFAAFIFMPSFYRVFSCLLLVMCLLHYLIFFNKNLQPEQVRRRMEAVFLLPWILMLV